MRYDKNIIHIAYILIFITCSNVVANQSKKVKNQPIKQEQAVSTAPAVLTTATMVKDEDTTSKLTRQEVDIVHFFCKPIDFTPEGISYYFKYVYNHPEYVNYLPYSLSHMIQFLQYGSASGQNEAFARSVIRMFLQKIKAAPYVEAEAFVEFLPKFNQAIKPYIEKKQANFLHEMQIVLKDKLSEIFAKYFAFFQKNPDSFMTSVAEQIAQQTNQSVTQQHIDVEHVKKDVLRFLETCSSKLIWSSKDDIQAWNNCNRLAYECKICLDNQILCSQDCLDDMCWSLIHRFCYFVELSAPNLSKNFYSQILHDLATQKLHLFALAEQEDLMTTKLDHLKNRISMCRDMCKSLDSQELIDTTVKL